MFLGHKYQLARIMLLVGLVMSSYSHRSPCDGDSSGECDVLPGGDDDVLRLERLRPNLDDLIMILIFSIN